MTTPSKKNINTLDKVERKRLIEAYVLTFGTVREVYLNISKRTEALMGMSKAKFNAEILKINKMIMAKYDNMYIDIKGYVLGNYNKGVVEQRVLTEKTVKHAVKWSKFTPKASIPSGDSFDITRKYLSKSNVLRRNNANMRRIEKLLKIGYAKGLPYQETNKKIAIELGYRRRDGSLTKKALDQLKKGQRINRSGQLAQINRITSNEMRRMSDLANNDNFLESKSLGLKPRLKMVASLISTSRTQSATMNGQLDGEPYGSHGSGAFNSRHAGKFQYPNGRWYIFGTHPSRWFINDRENVYTFYKE